MTTSSIQVTSSPLKIRFNTAYRFYLDFGGVDSSDCSSAAKDWFADLRVRERYGCKPDTCCLIYHGLIDSGLRRASNATLVSSMVELLSPIALPDALAEVS